MTQASRISAKYKMSDVSRQIVRARCICVCGAEIASKKYLLLPGELSDILSESLRDLEQSWIGPLYPMWLLGFWVQSEKKTYVNKQSYNIWSCEELTLRGVANISHKKLHTRFGVNFRS